MDIEKVALKKTGSVLRWCSEIVPIYLNEPDSTIQAARRFGENLGIAFQMTDDILDFKREDGAEFADLKNGVVNSVIFEALAMKSDSPDYDMSSIESITIEDRLIPIAIDIVAKQVRERLDTCRSIILQFTKRELPESKRFAQQQAFLAISSIIEYLGNRV